MPVRALFVVLAVVVAAAALFWSQTIQDPLKVSGFVEADEIRVGSRVGGRVHEVLVDEGQRLDAGAVILQLEPFDLQEKLGEARAQLVAATANFEKLKAGFRAEEIAAATAERDQARAAYEQAVAGPRKQEIVEAREFLRQFQADYDLAKIHFQRAEALFGKKAGSKEDLDRATSERKSLSARLEASRAKLEMLEEGTRKEEISQAKARLAAADAQLKLRQNGYRAEETAQAKAHMEAARAAVDVIQKQIGELVVKAPAACVVEAISLQPGDLVTANAPVVTLMDSRRMWVRAYLPENRLGFAQQGQKLSIGIDSFPNRRFAGRVSFISRQAEFTPNNVQTPDERSKQVFRIKVEIEEGLDLLRPGMAADVYLAELSSSKSP